MDALSVHYGIICNHLYTWLKVANGVTDGKLIYFCGMGCLMMPRVIFLFRG